MNERFDEIYSLYSRDIYKLIYSYILNIPDAEDILQKTFMKLYKNKKILALPNEDVKKWLIKVSINNAKDLLKSPWKKHISMPDSETGFYDLNTNETFDLLKSIPKDYRIALYLYYYQGYKIKEIAAITRKTESAIKMNLSRGKDKLRLEMEGFQ